MPVGSTPEELGVVLKFEIEKWMTRPTDMEDYRRTLTMPYKTLLPSIRLKPYLAHDRILLPGKIWRTHVTGN